MTVINTTIVPPTAVLDLTPDVQLARRSAGGKKRAAARKRQIDQRNQLIVERAATFLYFDLSQNCFVLHEEAAVKQIADEFGMKDDAVRRVLRQARTGPKCASS